MAEILVVDDEAHVRESIAAILEAEGHEVSQASNGRRALERVAERLPDLIVLDLAMPTMDGWHFLEELHARGLRRRTRVVIVSGRADEVAAGSARRATGGRFIAKPFESHALLHMVNDALGLDPDELYVRHDRSRNLARLIDKVDDALS